MVNEDASEFLKLPAPKLFEAGIFFSSALNESRTPDQIQDELVRHAGSFGVAPGELAKAIREIASDQENAAETVRLLLTLGASTGFQKEVDEAVEGAGQKQGLQELALLSPLVLGALFLLFTRGRKEQVQKLKVRIDGNKVQLDQENTVRYFSPGEMVAGILKQIAGRFLKSPDDAGEK